MAYVIEPYIEDEVTGKITPVRFSDPCAGFRGEAVDKGAKASAATEAVRKPDALSKVAIEKFISGVLKDFPTLPKNFKDTKSKINTLNKKLSEEKLKGNNTKKLEDNIKKLSLKLNSSSDVLKASYINFENGQICIIRRSESAPRWKLEEDLNKDQRDQATLDLMYAIDDFLGQVYFKIVSDGKPIVLANEEHKQPAATQVGAAAAGGTVDSSSGTTADEKGKPVLQYLKRVSLFGQPEDYAAGDKAIQEDLKIDGFSFFLNKTMFEGWRGVFKYFVLKNSDIVCETTKGIPEDIKKFFSFPKQSFSHGEREKSVVRVKLDSGISAFWIPYTFPDYLFPEEQDGTYVEEVDGKWIRKDLPKGTDNCVYRIAGDKLLALPFRATKATTRGGGGGMRSDRPNEAEDYRWGVNEKAQQSFAKALGLSFGLDVSKLITAKERGEWEEWKARLPETTGMRNSPLNSMDSEIHYWKKLPDTPKPGKKNEPLKEKPAPARPFSRLDAQGLYTKKQKGEVQKGGAAGKLPIRIAGPSGDRLSAASVMKGSATAFAKHVLSKSKEARETWKNLIERDEKGKKNVGAASPAVEIAYTVRTDQEWCHLVGHGDGGKEVPENFISGSKHCNTEQLAIETGQRTGRATYKYLDNHGNPGKEMELAVKVTAYLVPGELKDVPLNLKKNDIDFLMEMKILSDNKDISSANLEEIRKNIEEFIRDSEKKESIIAGQKGGDSLSALKGIHSLDKEAKKMKKNVQRLREMTKEPPPALGNFVRYKIFLKNKDADAKNAAGYTKIFDHTFDAQKESLDFFEYKIIESTVRRVIAIAAEREEVYRTAIQLKLAKLKVSGAKGDEDDG